MDGQEETKNQPDQVPSEDQEEFGFGIRKRSEDKLTYKLIIAGAIKQCMLTRGTVNYKYGVENLISVIQFDISGYHFIPKITEIRERLDKEKEQKLEKYKEELGLDFKGNAEQAIIRLDIFTWYWNTLFQGIIQLLAEYNLLMETQKYIPIREKRIVTDEE